MDPIAENTLNLPETIPPKMRLALTMLSNGSRLREIQAETGLLPSKVSAAALTHGVVRGVFAETRVATDFVAGGMSVADAAAKTGIPEHRIYYALRQQTPGKMRKKRRIGRNADIGKWADIAAMRDSGASLGEIGAFFAISRQRVHQILAKHDALTKEE